ncbi:recombinase family protein [Microbacterium sp. Au-Mic1]|uniref:recombinase family protein n=1 Tax=Microbacterium sp. Au-Mic1 TaxID=2906457 RepID=UPI001E2A32C4|nr:recombinase family protein [Microbacterium sp. Au-Mic1]MCE4024675.1 recombinase family protein [Microbacterium sp. Au-Mic1]
MTESVKAAIYVRQSVDQAEGITRGIKRCEALLKSRGWTLVETYADNAVSASKSRAKSRWADLLRDAKAGRFTHIVGVDMDRLVRSVSDLLALTDTGAKVLTVDGEIDLTTADGEFRATMLASIARFEVRRKAERQKRANIDRVTRRGLPVPGKRRFGYEPGNIEERTEEADRVRWAFAEVLSGGSIFGIAKAFGKPPVRIREMLTNPAYAGWIPFGGERYEAAPEVARIVSREDWEKVQAVLAAPERRTSPGNTIQYLASGIARCGICDARMVKQGAYYLCKGDLSHPAIKREILDDVLMWEAFSYLLRLDPGAEPEELQEAVQKLAEAQRKRGAVQAMFELEGADTAALTKRLAVLGREVTQLTAEVDALRVRTVAGDVVGRIRAKLAGTLNDEEGAAWWAEEWAELPLSDKREVIGNLTIKVHKGRGPDRVEVA